MKNQKKALLGGVVALALNSAATMPVWAVEATDGKVEATDGKQVFDPDYFSQYAPRTALDMVSRIPGFQISGGDGKRGLGQGGANVLINGKRISGKIGPRDQLSRITAPSVVRIGIVDGTSLDIPGLSGQVANVITKNTGISGTWEWRPQWRNRLQANWLNGKATISGENGKLSWNASVENDSFRNGNRGLETQTFADGTLFETRYEDAQFYGDNPGISVDLTYTPKEDHIANLNLEFYQFNFNMRETSKRTAITADGTTQETLFSSAEDEYNWSAGGDYEMPAGPKSLAGKLKLIGYYRFEHSPTISRFDIFHPTQGLSTSERFFRLADEAEAIARAEYSWKRGENKDWQLGIEGAFNYLDIGSSFTELNVTPDNPDNARVEEKRAEATLTHSRTLSPKWSVQASVGVEYSQLTQINTPDITLPADAPFVQSFVRPKGFLTATYKHDDSLSIVTKLEREVGQLNFFDFISQVSLQDDLDTAANPNLVPSQSWNAEVVLDKNFGDGNTFKATIYARLISDLVDRIPIGVDGDGVGNIDSAHRYGIDLAATFKGDKWGIKGTELNLQYEYRWSSVDDPLLGFSRRLNGDKVSYWSAEFRHDIPKTDWAYGLFADQFIDAPVYRISTINKFSFAGPLGQVYIEHKDVFGLKVRATVANAFDGSEDFRRQIFTDRRDLGVLDYTEDRSRDFDPFFRLRVSGTF